MWGQYVYLLSDNFLFYYFDNILWLQSQWLILISNMCTYTETILLYILTNTFAVFYIVSNTIFNGFLEHLLLHSGYNAQIHPLLYVCLGVAHLSFIELDLVALILRWPVKVGQDSTVTWDYSAFALRICDGWVPGVTTRICTDESLASQHGSVTDGSLASQPGL